MFGTRRLAKRSIVGTRVCAIWGEDGLYYPGTIHSTSEWAGGQDVYNVYFDHNKCTKTYQDKELIGPGFQTMCVANLRKGQRVFITHNSRETSGLVLAHERGTDDVRIEVELNRKEKIELTRKLEDVRLVVSRRSARLQDHQSTNYSHMADLPTDFRRRTVSHNIDVPVTDKISRPRRRTISLPSDGIDEEIEDNMDTDDEYEKVITPDQNSDVMDETMAAMVLTSFSCSPLSPGQTILHAFQDKEGNSPSTTASSIGSSGVWGMGGKSSPQQFSGSSSSSTPSTHQYLSSSAPINSGNDTLFGTSPIDEGIEVDDSEAYFEDFNNTSRKRRMSTRTVFKCLWPSCSKLYNTCTGIEKHVRYDHLGPKKPQPNCDDTDDSDEVSDHEEEFYYTEVEVSVDTVTQTFADMHTSSPPNTGPFSRDVTTPTSLASSSLPDHDYQKKSLPLSIPHSSNTQRGSSLPGSLTLSTPKVSRSLSWQNTSAKMSKMSPVRGYTYGTPPKNSPAHKKTRSDTKKCRKYYGMENRDLWCTQCKWKKACTRFLDYYSHASKIRTFENKSAILPGSLN